MSPKILEVCNIEAKALEIFHNTIFWASLSNGGASFFSDHQFTGKKLALVNLVSHGPQYSITLKEISSAL